MSNIKEWNNPELWQLGIESTENQPTGPRPGGGTPPGTSDNLPFGQGGINPGQGFNQHS